MFAYYRSYADDSSADGKGVASGGAVRRPGTGVASGDAPLVSKLHTWPSSRPCAGFARIPRTVSI
ncbi:hypothetical protein C440_01645 [Haloferax mucosum ATCC BAA-1512]|uniref:Uncharacterized protein n=1 Tax=Haloferax mucosum ATCC BAA-1512 TaxID=662479 RepID=M0IU90_9EURY|nr:hypothetical protein C440_01645 [Haloferax mucosum ATCC BAA-1512]